MTSVTSLQISVPQLISMSGNTYGYHLVEMEGGKGHLEARDADKHPTVHKIGPEKKKNCPIQRSVMLRFRNPV